MELTTKRFKLSVVGMLIAAMSVAAIVVGLAMAGSASAGVSGVRPIPGNTLSYTAPCNHNDFRATWHYSNRSGLVKASVVRVAMGERIVEQEQFVKSTETVVMQSNPVPSGATYQYEFVTRFYDDSGNPIDAGAVTPYNVMRCSNGFGSRI